MELAFCSVRVIVITAAMELGVAQPAAAQPPPTYPHMAYSDEHYLHRLDLWVPDGCVPRPLAIYIHGGGWVVGDKAEVAPYVDSLLTRGFAVASINYRFSYNAIFPAQIHDCKGAVRWLRANAASFNLDASRFAVFGDSAGGHLAALLATSAGVVSLEGTVGGNAGESSAVQAAADFYGPTDLFALGSIPPHDAPDSIVSQLFGHPIQDIIQHVDDPAYAELVALVNSANPVTHVTPGDPQFYIAHGDADTYIPPSQSQVLYDALVNAGVPAELRLVPGARHGLPLPEYQPAFNLMRQLLEALPHDTGDVNCDGQVNFDDILAIIQSWGVCAAAEQPCAADVNGDLAINFDDILIVLSHWG